MDTISTIVMNKYDPYGILVQKALLETVAPDIVVDGIPGKNTLKHLGEFSLAHGLPVPSDFSGPGWDLLQKYIAQRFVDDGDFEKAAAELGVKQSAVRAVAETESRGNGFLKRGKVKLLFERHKFYKYLGEALKQPVVRQHIQDVLSISVPKTDKDLLNLVCNKYPDICNSVAGGYKGDLLEHDRLDLAMSLDPYAALMSASYGMYQIMGFNHKLAGYDSPNDMYIAFSESEKNQFWGFVNFIKNNPNIWSALKRNDWLKFAEGYNGKAFATNDYNNKVKRAEEKYRSYN